MGGFSSREPNFAARHTAEVLDDGATSKILKRRGTWFLTEDPRRPGVRAIVKRKVERRKDGSVYVDFFDLREGPSDMSGFPFDWLTTPGLGLGGFAQNAIERARKEIETVAAMSALTAEAATGNRPKVRLEQGDFYYYGIVTPIPMRGGLVMVLENGKVFRFAAKHGWRIAK
jgi:hypothetical protein